MAPSRELKCLRCGAQMQLNGRYEFQLGRESGLNPLLAVALSKSLEMDIYECPNCSKLEFYPAE